MKKNSVLRKVLAVALSAVTLLGTGFTTAGQFVGTSISVSAAVYGDFEYKVNDDNTVTITDFTEDYAGGVTIPSKIDGKRVTEIADSAFNNCCTLLSVTIPDSITKIGSAAFLNCINLRIINIPDSVTQIGGNAFVGTMWYNNQPNGWVYAGKVLYDYKGKTMPDDTSIAVTDGTVAIADYAFNGYTNLKKIIIPDSLTCIGSSAFSGCTELTDISIPENVTHIGSYAFFRCTGLTDITLPKNMTYIGSYAFSRCTGLTDITIPYGVTEIGQRTFYGCTNLENITIPYSVTSIGDNALDGCTKLKGINIPDSITQIDNHAFSGCTSLESVTIPDSLTKIGCYLFSGCTGLKNVTIPNSVTSICEYAFQSCTSLTNIIIPDSVISISQGSFWNCTELVGITLPESVTSIDPYSFYYCNKLTIYGQNDSYAEIYAKKKNIPFVAVTLNNSTVSAKEIVIGQTVTVNAKASEDNCTYSVLYKKKTQSKWTTAQDFGTNDTVKIKPASVADYDICVKVKDGSGKIAKKYFEVKVNAKLANTSTIAAENITLGQQITVNGLAQGGVGAYQYQVVYKQTSQSKWTVTQDFATNAKVTFKPAKATSYDVCIRVKDRNGTVVKKTFTVQVNAKLTNTSTISATTVKKGSTVTVNGSAKGGAGDYTYAVMYKQKAQSKWTTKQDFSTNANVSVKPGQTTDYDICIKVKDKDGTIVKKYFAVTVTK